ncbi:MAG: hypothetical protein E6933_06600 [Clostridiales bacterium]|nr:hypothetical protein [Clostridiales bacterium]
MEWHICKGYSRTETKKADGAVAPQRLEMQFLHSETALKSFFKGLAKPAGYAML